jgi:UDP-N-acetylmuramoyl-L-alanyl-D-glutamate--2,6-diaminopimelate ligase
MPRTLADLASAAGVSPVAAWRDVEITGVAQDSRQVAPGDLFVAVRGFVTDGHDHIGEAVVRGARAVVVERDVSVSVPVLRVADGRVALAQVAAAFYGHPTRELFTVGVTGTKGKTTVCHLVAHLLGLERTALVSTVTNEDRDLRATTTPSGLVVQRLAREALDAGKEAFVLETSSAALALHRVREVDFDVGVFTNLTHDHLDFHADWRDYQEAKRLLFRGLRRDAWAVVNTDDPAAPAFLEVSPPRRLTFSVRSAADLAIAGLTLSQRGSTFALRHRGDSAEVTLRLPGEHNVSNALAAAAVAIVRGLSVEEVALSLSSARSVLGRYQFFRREGSPEVVVDFAHTPDSFERMLRSLRPHYGRVVSVFGCGGESDRAKRPLMGEISGRLAEVTILTSDNPKSEDPCAIIDEIERGIVPTRGKYERILDRREAIRRALAAAGPGDVVLLAGKGHETYQIVGHDFVPYSDAGFLRELGFDEAREG